MSGFPMTRAERRRVMRHLGRDPKLEYEAVQQRSLQAVQTALRGQTCGWCGQSMGNPQFHPPPDYGCAKAPLMLKPPRRADGF